MFKEGDKVVFTPYAIESFPEIGTVDKDVHIVLRKIGNTVEITNSNYTWHYGWLQLANIQKFNNKLKRLLK